MRASLKSSSSRARRLGPALCRRDGHIGSPSTIKITIGYDFRHHAQPPRAHTPTERLCAASTTGGLKSLFLPLGQIRSRDPRSSVTISLPLFEVHGYVGSSSSSLFFGRFKGSELHKKTGGPKPPGFFVSGEDANVLHAARRCGAVSSRPPSRRPLPGHPPFCRSRRAG